MKQTLLTFTLVSLFLSCGKDDTTITPTCVKKSLDDTMAGKWKQSNNNAILEFKLGFSYTDASKSLHSCTDGIWSTSGGDKLVLACSTNFKEIRINKFTCDTVNLQLSGIGAVNLIRQ